MSGPRVLASCSRTIARTTRGCAAGPSRRPLHASARWSRDLGARYRRPAVVDTTTKLQHHDEPPPLHGPVRREKAVLVEGVSIPPRPIPPGDEDCCMSGCVHCVLTIYADDMEEYNSALSAAQARLEAKGIPLGKWPAVMTEGDGGEADEPKVDPSMAAFMALEASINAKSKPAPAKVTPKPRTDPTLAAFLALEQKIKKKHQGEAGR